MEVFETTKSFPKEEKYSLTDQIRRSSRSVGSNIAESWLKRKYVKSIVSKLIDSQAEACETILGSISLWLHAILKNLNSTNFSSIFKKAP